MGQLHNNFDSFCKDDFKNSTLEKARYSKWWCLSIDTKGALHVRFWSHHDPLMFDCHFLSNQSEQLVVLYPPTTPLDAQNSIETPHSPRRKTKRQCRKLTDKRKRKKCKIRISLRRRNNVGPPPKRSSLPPSYLPPFPPSSTNVLFIFISHVHMLFPVTSPKIFQRQKQSPCINLNC